MTIKNDIVLHKDKQQKEISKNHDNNTQMIEEVFHDLSKKKIKKILNDISPGFCLAKWYQVTLHLQNGHTHSCHHPATHRVEPREIVDNPSALHNTAYKKMQRYRMLNGERPEECSYCWRVENASEDNISDRYYKSSEKWAFPYIEEAKNLPWNHDFLPRYLEVSFGHACNFKCMYCMPHISSSIMAEFEKEGHFVESPENSLHELYVSGKYPIPKDAPNPYVEAFWRWWPELKDHLEFFRITGGEPLINPNTFRFLEYIVKNPMPHLNFSINSNLGIPSSQYQKFLNYMKQILENGSIKYFEFYTSVDTYGSQAEYIRSGLNYKTYMDNVRMFLDEMPSSTKVIFMCTFNALSVSSFRKFLQDVVELKKSYRTPDGLSRVILDIPYLNSPNYLNLSILTPELAAQIELDIEFMKNHQMIQSDSEDIKIFDSYEISKLERIYRWYNSNKDDHYTRSLRKKFYTFIKEYDRRRGTDFLKTFPQMKSFFEMCKDMYHNDELSEIP